MGIRKAGRIRAATENEPNNTRLPTRGFKFRFVVDSFFYNYSEWCGTDSIQLLKDDARHRGIPVSCHNDPE